MTSKLRRGFKTDAERIAVATRQELGLTVHDRLDCYTLADHLGIPILSLGELYRDGAALVSIGALMEDEAKFSALTVCAGTRRLIIYNPAEHPGRHANSLAHELSHILLEHPPAPALEGGCRRWAGLYEEEADWLAGALLVPRDGAMVFAARGDTLQDGARHFGVSVTLYRWRVNVTGVQRQVNAAASRPPSRRYGG